MNIVIYARYSSHSQTEQSIEGQLQTCHEFAKHNGHIVIGEYIDRAQSGTTDSRAEFQRMIADSDKHAFEGVLVYQLDRFARNRYELNQASPTFETLTRYADYFDVSMDYIFGRTDNPQGKLYEYKPKIQQNDPQMQKFVEMCFDPASPMNARLKETLLQMLGEAKQ